MKVVIDKFEASYAIVELPDRSYALIPRKLVEDADVGDIIEIRVKHKEDSLTEKLEAEMV